MDKHHLGPCKIKQKTLSQPERIPTMVQQTFTCQPLNNSCTLPSIKIWHLSRWWHYPFLFCKENVPCCDLTRSFHHTCGLGKGHCHTSSYHWVTVPPLAMTLTTNILTPGNCHSCDHYISPVPEQITSISHHSSTCEGFWCGTIHVDHTSGWIFHWVQRTLTASDTIHGKWFFERNPNSLSSPSKCITWTMASLPQKNIFIPLHVPKPMTQFQWSW